MARQLIHYQPISKGLAIGVLALPIACAGPPGPDPATATATPAVVSVAYAYPANALLCRALVDQVSVHSDSKTILDTLEIEGGWQPGQPPALESIETAEADINHDRTSDRIYSSRLTRPLRPPVEGEVEYQLIFYRLGDPTGALNALPKSVDEIMMPREQGGMYVRFDMDRLQGGSRPFQIPESIRTYRASIISLEKRAYIFLQSPPPRSETPRATTSSIFFRTSHTSRATSSLHSGQRKHG